MSNSKPTDSEIVKALECCCGDNGCFGCPYTENHSCRLLRNPIKDALDLINRLQAENETLRTCVEQIPLIRKDGKSPLSLLTADIKAEAYKEFAERLKKRFPSYDEPYQYWEIHEGTDNLLKELVGEDNA